jgi:ParB family transcriptional regulator, chromosome partitioning protein
LEKTFLDLCTVSELESLAGELGLRQAMGRDFKTARAGKKAEFIAGLLAVKAFEYRGVVPQVMRYPRLAVIGSAPGDLGTPPGDMNDDPAGAHPLDDVQALVA